MPQVTVCDAAFADVYAAMHKACFAKAWNESMMRQTLLMPGALGLIAFENETPAGFLIDAYSIDQADIVTLGVMPAFRGKKIGDLLLETSFERLKQNGVADLFLEVAVNNPHAIELYRRHDFKQVGKRPNYYTRGDEKIDALVMKRAL